MGYKEEYEEKQRKLGLELDELAKTCTEAELDARFFKNFGCINFKSDEFFHELGLARLWHKRQIENHPDKHKVEYATPFNCYHETFCKCGFKEACDSSG